jgi:restriction endonuclease S subunit
MKTLGEVCEVARGTSITRKQTKEGSIPVIAGGIDVAYFHSVHNRPAGTITISSSGANAGFVNRWDVPIFASDCSTVVAKEGGLVFGEYAFRFLQFKQGFINDELRRGTAQPHVYAKDIAAIEITVPPLKEQKRIVARLDQVRAKASEMVAAYGAKLQAAKDFRQSILEAAFSGEL